MHAFNRDVFRQLFVGMILVTVGLTCVLWMSQSLRFVDFIVNRGLDLGTFLYLIALMLPNFMLVIMPIAVFATVVFTYAKLINDREMVVMGAVGVSPLALAGPAIVLALIVMTIAYALYMTVLPASYRTFRELQWDLRYNFARVLLEEGAFTDASDGITVYVRERSPDGQLRGILVHDAREAGQPHTLIAERGALVSVDGGARVVLFNGSRQSVDAETDALSVLYFERYVFDLELTRRDSADRYRPPEERTLRELFAIADDPAIEARDHGKFIVEAHRRITAPLSTLGFTLIGTAFLLQGRFQRGSQGRNAAIAVVTAVAILLATFGLQNLAGRNPALIPLIYATTLLPIIGGFIALARPRRLRVPPMAPEPTPHG